MVLIIVLITCSIQAQHGLKAEYYNGVNFEEFVAEQYVGNIDQDWNFVPPVPGLDPHSCSIRWTGKLMPNTSREYIFSARVDDGIKVWLDDNLIIDQWVLNDQGVFQGKIYLNAGQEYKIKVDYFNALREGEIHLLWNVPSEEQSWYEYFFEASSIPIPQEFFFRPDEPDLITEIMSKPPLEKPKKVTPKKPKKPIKKEEVKPIIVEPIIKQSTIAPQKIMTAKEAENFIPKNVAFERGKSIILESSIDELDLFSKFMFDNPQVQVRIEGHSDPVGDEALNLALSNERANKVADFLVQSGIDDKRIEAKGFGGSQPLVIPKKGGYYPANRRVVFVLSGLD